MRNTEKDVGPQEARVLHPINPGHKPGFPSFFSSICAGQRPGQLRKLLRLEGKAYSGDSKTAGQFTHYRKYGGETVNMFV